MARSTIATLQRHTKVRVTLAKEVPDRYQPTSERRVAGRSAVVTRHEGHTMLEAIDHERAAKGREETYSRLVKNDNRFPPFPLLHARGWCVGRLHGGSLNALP